MTIRQLMAHFNMSEAGVRSRLTRMGLTFVRKARPWTKQENWELYSLAEKYGAAEIAKRLNRPLGTIKKKLTQQKIKTYAVMYSLTRASEETGYTRDQLYRAKNGLGQTWAAYGKTLIKHRITPRQLDELCNWLKKEA